MDVLSAAGLPTVLFLDIPKPAELARFRGYRGIGIAGIARSRDPVWMDRHLPPVFAALAATEAPIAHYKTCSNLDSSPEIGSIGRAIDIGAAMFGGDWTPLVWPPRHSGRWQVFGNLFAVSNGAPHRLDRHPSMSRHPWTPMDESRSRPPSGAADRTADRAGGFSGLQSGGGMCAGGDTGRWSADRLAGMRWTRRRWPKRSADLADRDAVRFTVGSQGIEYALWHIGVPLGCCRLFRSPLRMEAVSRIVAVSGSCSPVHRRADRARREGKVFAAFHRRHPGGGTRKAWQRETARGHRCALQALGKGFDPLVDTALGPDDPAVAGCARRCAAAAFRWVK